MDARRQSCWKRFDCLGLMTILLVSVLAAESVWHSASGAGNNGSLIFVVDASAQMAPYLSNVKGAILLCADQAEREDYIGVISVQDTAKPLIVKKISGRERDLEAIERRLDALVAAGEAGDMVQGVARAAEEIGKLKRKGDRNTKGIVIVAASNPRDTQVSADILKTAADEISENMNIRKWYTQYCYLGGIRNGQVEDFVSENRGICYDVDALQSQHRTDTIVELYRIVSEPERLCGILIHDLSGTILGRDPAGKEWIPLEPDSRVSEKTQFRVATNSRAVITLGEYGKLGVAPETDFTLVSARENPLSGEAYFHMELKAGTAWIHLIGEENSTLRVLSADMTFVMNGGNAAVMHMAESDEIVLASFFRSLFVRVLGSAGEPATLGLNQSVRLGHGEMLEQIGQAESHFVEKWKCWDKALIGKASLASIEFTVPEIVFSEESIAIGPIKSGETQDLRFPLRIVGVKDVTNLKMDIETSVVLPDGLYLSTGIVDGDSPEMKALLIKIDGSNGFSSRRSEAYTGFIKIMPAGDSGVTFAKIPIPLSIKTRGPIASPMVLLIGTGLVLLGAVAVGAALAMRSRISERPVAHRVIGRLIVVDDPTGGRVGTINLEDMSTRASRLSLAVGRDRSAEVRLKHASVKSQHCTIEAHLVGGSLTTYLEPVGSAKVVVDGERIDSRTPLEDGSIVTIGEFKYQFEDTQFYKKVEVVYKNRKRILGILDAAGMDAKGFKLSPVDAVSPSERARVNFADIRHITFYRRFVDVLSAKPRPFSKQDTMRRVEFMFRKGETLSGYIRREYVEGRHTHFELLPLDPASDIDYTLVESSEIVERKDV